VIVDVLLPREAARHQQRELADLEGGERGADAGMGDDRVGSIIAAVSSTSGIASWPSMPSPETSVSPVCQSTSTSAGRIASKRLISLEKS
jgi:hypothetical protein